MQYLYETHLHTSQSSSCSRTLGKDYVKIYKDLGYSGIIVTDHFFKGNPAMLMRMTKEELKNWSLWIENFCMGYEDALDEGIREGLDVFFGWEAWIGRDEYLVYGLDKTWLLAHSDILSWDIKTLYKNVKEAGGCIVLAHPFRNRVNYSTVIENNDEYISNLDIPLGFIDGIEVGNGGTSSYSNYLARLYAQKHNLPQTAGTDAHSDYAVEKEGHYGTYLDRKISSISDFVDAILENKIKGIEVPKGTFEQATKE